MHDPYERSLECGFDIHGNPVELYERDTDGTPVGYIDPDGLAWEDRAERDRAILNGRLWDAFVPYWRCGFPFELTDHLVDLVADRYHVLPQNRWEARADLEDNLRIAGCPQGIEHRARRAALN